MTNFLLLYNSLIPSVRLCAYEQLNYLSRTGKIHFQHCKAAEITRELFRNSDVVIMVRSDSYLEEALAKIFKKAGKYLVYVLDDDLLNVPPGLSSSSHYRSKEVTKRIKNIMNVCDCLLSPSKKILEKYGPGFTVTGLIEEPALLYKDPGEKDREKIKIGFAGSVDRGGDIDSLLSDALREISQKYKDRVEIEFYGARPSFIESMGLTLYPYEDNYEDYKRKLCELNWHIGLAPLPDSDFHRSKHYNKYIEYCTTDTIGIYSNVYPYTEIIQDGKNGFLCENTKEAWVEKISYCIDNYYSMDSVRQCVKKDAETRFSLVHTADVFARAIPEISHSKAFDNKQSIKCFIVYEIFLKTSLVNKILYFIKRHGVKTPIVLYRKFLRGQ